MKTLVSAVSACAALAALFSPNMAAALEPPMLAQPSDEAQITALQESVAAAISAKDVDAIMKGYSPDVFVFDVVPPRQYVGEAAWRADWEGVFKSMAGPMKASVGELVIHTDGNIAYSHAIQHFASAGPGGTTIEMNIRASDAYRKIDGKWLIVEEHLSVPVDMASGKPDMMSKP